MRLQTEGAVDATGKALPVFIPDTKATIAYTLTTSAVVAATFGATAKTYPYLIPTTSAGTTTITAKQGGYDGSHISVTIAAAANNAENLPIVTISGKDITITPDNGNSTIKQVIDALALVPAASALITITSTDTDATITADQHKRYLSGWDSGNLGTLVRVYNGSSAVTFIGVFPESAEGTEYVAASMPIGIGATEWIMVGPGEAITAMGTAGQILYLTPMRKY